MILSSRGEPLVLAHVANAVATGGRPWLTGEDGRTTLDHCEPVLAASHAVLADA